MPIAPVGLIIGDKLCAALIGFEAGNESGSDSIFRLLELTIGDSILLNIDQNGIDRVLALGRCVVLLSLGVKGEETRVSPRFVGSGYLRRHLFLVNHLLVEPRAFAARQDGAQDIERRVIRILEAPD